MASTKIPLAGVLSILGASLTMMSVAAQSQQPAQPPFNFDAPAGPMMPMQERPYQFPNREDGRMDGYDDDFGRMMMPYDYPPGYGPDMTNPNAMLGPYRTVDRNAVPGRMMDRPNGGPFSFGDGYPFSSFDDMSEQMPPPSSNDADVIPRRPSSDLTSTAPDATSPPTNNVPSPNTDRDDNANALPNRAPTADRDMSDSFPFDSMDPFDFGLDEADEADFRRELGNMPFQEDALESGMGPAPTPAPDARMMRVSQESDDEGERTTRRRRQTFVTVTATVTVTIRETPTMMATAAPTNTPMATPTDTPAAVNAAPTPAATPTATPLAPTNAPAAAPMAMPTPAEIPVPAPMAQPTPNVTANQPESPILDDTTLPVTNDSSSETTNLDRDTAVEPSPDALPDSTTFESPTNSDNTTIDSPDLNNSTTTNTDSPNTEELNGEVTPYSTDDSNSNTNSTEGGDFSSPSDNSTDLSLPSAGHNGTTSNNGTESGKDDPFRNGTSTTNTTRNDSSTGNGTDGRLESGAVQAGLLREFVHTAGIGLAVAVVLFGAL
ncbi:hypothetical protein HK102_006608 [Quaeritorhiza haematococci]|nr:hypothetical protein HK102_006608 [Quaeritorhiza haematococci]